MNMSVEMSMDMNYKTILLTAALLTGCLNTPNEANASQKPSYDTYIEKGQAFPINQFTNIQGEQVNLATDKRKLIVLFSTWCSDSQRFVKQLTLSPLIADTDLQIIGIGREDTIQGLEKFSQKFKTSFSMVADPERKIYSQFANAGVPRLILLDKNDNVVRTLIGEAFDTIDQVVW
jgi:hypothetical protein